MIPPSILLASESPRRRELLGRLGIDFKVETAPVEELTAAADPRSVPLLNAAAKAAAVAARHPAAAVIGADTVICFDDRIIGKPCDLKEARHTLLELSGATHEVITGVALICRNRGLEKVWSEISRVTFKPLSPERVDEYLRLVHVLDKAGSYALQEHGDLIIDRVEGDPDNIVGLPLGRLRRELANLN